MAQNTARIGRRRRVLKEEVLNAGASASTDVAFAPGDTPRYGAGANIENHPQVTDLIPRKYRTIALVLAIGLSVAIAAEFAAHFSTAISDFVPAISPIEISTAFADRLTAWTTAVVLLVAAGYTRLIFSLRRYRVDDYRGRYRIWRLAGWAAVALSFNAVVGCHTVVAQVVGHYTPWSLLPGHAGWWLAGSALVGGWLLLKLILDAAECRCALFAFLLALVCFIVAGVSAAGWSPDWALNWPDAMVRALPLAGHLLLLTGALLFARYVVLDVQGLIEHKAVAAAQAVKKSTSSSREAAKAVQQSSDAPTVVASLAKQADEAWIDGSESEHQDDEGPGRRLSKAERKRLRKQKSRNRAA